MMIPTEPIASIPRPPALVAAWREGRDPVRLAVGATIGALDAPGCPVRGAPNTARDGFRIPLAGGHGQRLPHLPPGPLRYRRYADDCLRAARRHATQALKPTVILPSPSPPPSPFRDDAGHGRAPACTRIRARVEGKRLAARIPGGAR